MQEKIINILADITEDTTLKEWANERTSITNDIGLDSLQLVTFILTVEDEFSVEIVFEEFDFRCLDSIQAFCSFVDKSRHPEAL